MFVKSYVKKKLKINYFIGNVNMFFFHNFRFEIYEVRMVGNKFVLRQSESHAHNSTLSSKNVRYHPILI